MRLAGFGVTNFTDRPEEEPADLFGAPSLDAKMKKRERLSAALDAIRRRTDGS